MTFSDKWKTIQYCLAPGTEVKNWTAKNGYLGDSFTVIRVSPAYIVVTSPAAENEQKIPKGHFEKLSAQWSGYCAGSVQRQEIREFTRFSKYIISIFNHVSR